MPQSMIAIFCQDIILSFSIDFARDFCVFEISLCVCMVTLYAEPKKMLNNFVFQGEKALQALKLGAIGIDNAMIAFYAI